MMIFTMMRLAMVVGAATLLMLSGRKFRPVAKREPVWIGTVGVRPMKTKQIRRLEPELAGPIAIGVKPMPVQPTHRQVWGRRVLVLLGLCLEAGFIVELWRDNFNQYFWLKVALSALMLTTVTLARGRRMHQIVLGIVLEAMALIAVLCGLYYARNYPLPTTHVEREVMASRTLMAAGASYAVAEDGTVPSGTYVVVTDGTYRYYFVGPHGKVRQGSINADNVLVRYCAKGEVPRLEQLHTYDLTVSVRNGQETATQANDVYWYEMCVPAGSVVERANDVAELTDEAELALDGGEVIASDMATGANLS